MANRMDLFTPVVEKEKMHPNFLASLKGFSKGVRDVLDVWADGFIDRDGKFVKEFQTTYNSGFWELYLYAVLKYLKIHVDFSYSSPDFVCPDNNVIIEATIASNAHDDVPEWEKNFKRIGEEDFFEMCKHATIRLSNAFQAKRSLYTRKYSSMPHVKDKPFIIAISNFSMESFSTHGDVPMQWLLYDIPNVGHLQKKNGATVPIGIFNSSEFSEISAVLYSSLATFSKARALGNDNDDFVFTAVRIKNNFYPELIKEKKSVYRESLCDGLRLFINPFAKNPINLDDFDIQDIRTFLVDSDGGFIVSCHEQGDLCMRFSRYIPTK
jgi:hypothetical protein